MLYAINGLNSNLFNSHDINKYAAKYIYIYIWE